LIAEGGPEGIEPIGIDAWMLLRTEKGYLHIGADTDGTTTPADVGWERVLKRAGDFIGRRSLTLPENLRTDRLQFVGLECEDSGAILPVGTHVAGGEQGYVTSSGFSPTLGYGVALGMIRAGRARHGEVMTFTDGRRSWRARITPPGAYDREGERLNG
jgi:sarcosine oxidase subunit alpha